MDESAPTADSGVVTLWAPMRRGPRAREPETSLRRKSLGRKHRRGRAAAPSVLIPHFAFAHVRGSLRSPLVGGRGSSAPVAVGVRRGWRRAAGETLKAVLRCADQSFELLV